MNIADTYALRTLALADADAGDWTTCWDHGTPLAHHIDAPCPGCQIAAGDPADLTGRCNHCLDLLTDPDSDWCSVRCRTADVQVTDSAQAALDAWRAEQ